MSKFSIEMCGLRKGFTDELIRNPKSSNFHKKQNNFY